MSDPMREALEKIVQGPPTCGNWGNHQYGNCRGLDGGCYETYGNHEDDARHVYPARIQWMREVAKAALDSRPPPNSQEGRFAYACAYIEALEARISADDIEAAVAEANNQKDSCGCPIEIGPEPHMQRTLHEPDCASGEMLLGEKA